MAYITVRFNEDGLVSERYSTHNHDPLLDTVAPVITLKGNATIGATLGDPFVDPGVTATDNLDGDISEQVVVTGSVNVNVPGSYTLRYNVSDTAGNVAQEIRRTVVVGDFEPPVITIIGDPSVQIEQGDEYEDYGAFATDNVDGDVTDNITVTITTDYIDGNGNVARETHETLDTSIPGTYVIRYNCTDSSGNIAQEVVRTVEVLDVTPPTIEFLGTNPTYIVVGSTYSDAGVVATDNAEGDITARVLVDNQVNSGVVGTYAVRYNVSDTAGNVAAERVRTVYVQNADGVPPVITLNGSSTITITQGDTYNDPGASAVDETDGNLTNKIVVTNTVDTAEVGTYYVYYNVADKTGNNAEQVIRTVIVREPDTLPPVITLKGSPNVSVYQHDVYTDEGATAVDDRDGNLTAAIETENPVDTAVPGAYQVKYRCKDLAGNEASPAVRTVSVQDGRYPVITMLGQSPVTVPVGDPYVDAGATANDQADGDITNDIIATSTVDTDTVGTYTVRYNVVDSEGYPALEVTRTVQVVDADPPTITLLGDVVISQQQGQAFVDPGVTAADNQDGDITGDVVVTGSVDTDEIGTYVISYSVVDSSGNHAQVVQRTVHITDGLPPVITLEGDNPHTVIKGHPFVEPGFTATDNLDGDLTDSVVVQHQVNVNVEGSYPVVYTVDDAAGNIGSVTRTVNVVVPDTTRPVITLLGANPLQLTVGNAYVDPGATAADDSDGDISGNIIVTNPVNHNKVGTYTVRYNVKDAAGNNANEVTRTVEVLPVNRAPVITLVGPSTIFLELGESLVDPGATATDFEDGDLTDDVVATSTVNHLETGVYSVTYTVSDANGKQAEPVIRTVIVESDQEILVTANHNFLLPHKEHYLEDDVERLRQTIIAMDALIKAAQSAVSDYTSGSLIMNGGHGLGATAGEAITFDGVDLNNKVDNVRAYCLVTCSNRPSGAGAGWLYVDPGTSTDSTAQCYHELSNNQVWVRTKASGVWGTWKRLVFHSEVAGFTDTNKVSYVHLSAPAGLSVDYAYLITAAGSYNLPPVGALSAGAAVRVCKTLDAGNPTIVVDGGGGEVIRPSNGDPSDTSITVNKVGTFEIIFNGTDWEV